MGLYDGYRLQNSQGIKQYEGSAVPEMVAVSQQLQGQYDKSQNALDYTNQFLNSLKADPKDQPTLDEMKKGYIDKIGEISQRKDLENMTRETSMLAAKLPQDYAPFAASLQAHQTRNAEIDAATQKKPEDAGYLSPDKAASQKEYEYSQYKGLQKNAQTNKLEGIYQGQNYSRSIDYRKKVDEIMEKALPSTQGYTHEPGSDGEWIVKKFGKTVTMAPGHIRNIIDSGMKADPEVQGDIGDQVKYGTHALDYRHVTRADVNDGTQLAKLMDNGHDATTAMKIIKGAHISDGIMATAQGYAGAKYPRHDVETGDEVKQNEGYWKHKLEDGDAPMVYDQSAITLKDLPKTYDDAQKFLGTNTPAVAALKAAAQSDDPSVRQQAMGQLASLNMKMSIMKSTQEAANNFAGNELVKQGKGAEYKKLKDLSGGYRDISGLLNKDGTPTPQLTAMAKDFTKKAGLPTSLMAGQTMDQLDLANYKQMVGKYDYLMGTTDKARDQFYADGNNVPKSYSPKGVSLDPASPAMKGINNMVKFSNPGMVILDQNNEPVADKDGTLRTKLTIGGPSVTPVGDLGHSFDATYTEKGTDSKPDKMYGTKYHIMFTDPSATKVAATHLSHSKNADARDIGNSMMLDFNKGNLKNLGREGYADFTTNKGAEYRVKRENVNGFDQLVIYDKVSGKPITKNGTKLSYPAAEQDKVTAAMSALTLEN